MEATMDQITAAMMKYDQHLRAGGEPIVINTIIGKSSQRTMARKIHPSGLGPGLCDRKACYNIMADTGEVQAEVETTPEQQLDFRAGFVWQEWIAKALYHAGDLQAYEIQLSNDVVGGTADLVMVQDNGDLALVDVKTVRNKSLVDSADLYPKPWNIAQVEAYLVLLRANEAYKGRKITPVLFYVSRNDTSTAYFTWVWNGRDCTVWRWQGGVLVYHKEFEDLDTQILKSYNDQKAWLDLGLLPNRCGETPDEHPFLCCDHDRKKKIATPTCAYFSRCWELSRDPFRFGEHAKADDWEKPW
jgi:hypothetical protein